MIKINYWRYLTNIEFLRLSFSVMYLIVLIWGSLTFLKIYLNISFFYFIEQNIHVIYQNIFIENLLRQVQN